MAELAVTLASYPSAQQLQQRLASLGLLEETVTPATDAAPIVARSLLRASGRLIGFAAETRRRPMGHDSKLRRLATRAGVPLADVIFEEVLVGRSAEREQYQIRAYFDGLRVAAELNLTDDCYDIKTMVGLLNTIARQLNANQRFSPVATNDEAAWIVFGPEPALQELVSEGLLRVSSGEHSHADAHAGH